MKTPTWEPSAGNLLAFLNANTQVSMVDLYTFTTVVGVVYRFAAGDRLVSVNGNSFAMGPRFARSSTRLTVGVEVDTLNVDAYADSTTLLGTASFVQAWAQGVMDNGTMMLERLFLDSSGAQQGTLLMFAGRIGQVVTERGHVGIEVLSHLTLLDIQIPVAVYQPGCRNTLFDNFCQAARATFSVSKAASTTTDTARSTFSASTITQAPGYYALGVALCTAGANVGISRTIKTHAAGGLIQVINPWPFAVATGDVFTFSAGCDKTKSTCVNTFNNVVHFNGEPYVPQPQTIT